MQTCCFVGGRLGNEVMRSVPIRLYIRFDISVFFNSFYVLSAHLISLSQCPCKRVGAGIADRRKYEHWVVILVVKFLRVGYKSKYIFGQKAIHSKDIMVF